MHYNKILINCKIIVSNHCRNYMYMFLRLLKTLKFLSAFFSLYLLYFLSVTGTNRISTYSTTSTTASRRLTNWTSTRCRQAESIVT